VALFTVAAPAAASSVAAAAVATAHIATATTTAPMRGRSNLHCILLRGRRHRGVRGPGLWRAVPSVHNEHRYRNEPAVLRAQRPHQVSVRPTGHRGRLRGVGGDADQQRWRNEHYGHVLKFGQDD
jgi:hypothetical protein